MMYHPYEQEYLLQCPYREINLPEHLYDISSDELRRLQSWTVERNLFDYPNGCERLILLSWLDSHTGTPEKWQTLVSQLSHVDRLVIADDRLKTRNPIIGDRDEASLKAYIYRFEQAGIPCDVCSTELEND